MSLQILIDSTKLELLEAGGVDNWGWYGESIQQFREMNDIDDDEDLDTSDILSALENGGVDNWDWYGESLDRFYEWTEHAEKFYGTDKFMDYYEFISEDNARLEKEEESKEALEQKRIEQEKHDALLKKLDEYAYKKLFDMVLEVVHYHDYALTKFEELSNSPSLWSGLGDPVGLKLVDKSKKKAEKYIKDNKLPFNMINYMPKAREYYIDEIVKTEAFKKRFSEIVK